MTLTDDEKTMVDLVRDFVDKRVRPNVRQYEETDTCPEAFIEEMKELGFFGLLVPAEFGGVDVSTVAFARVTEELARGWMSLAGAIGGHSVITCLVRTFGTPRRHGHQDARGPAADHPMPPNGSTTDSVPTWRREWPSSSRPRPPCKWPWTRCACTAATASRGSTTSNATFGTRHS